HVRGLQVFGMLCVDRNGTEDAKNLVQHDDFLGRLNNLHREQSDGGDARNAGRHAARLGVVDSAAVVKLQHLLRGPGLIGRRLASRQSRAGRELASANPEFSSGRRAVGLLPGSDAIAASLPDSGQIWFPVSSAWNGARLGERRSCNGNGTDQDETSMRHGCDTGGTLPPSPVPAGGPKNSFLPSLKVTSLECAHAVPSRASQPVTVIESPAFKVTSLFQPVR